MYIQETPELINSLTSQSRVRLEKLMVP